MERGTTIAGTIAKHSHDEACSFVDDVLGTSEAWSSHLIAYRLRSDAQADWKCEIGRWLLFAEAAGFLPEILKRVSRARQLPVTPPLANGAPDPNDQAHSVLQHELAAAQVAYYLCANGWSFGSIPGPIVGGDVDLRMLTPNGISADIQIKASDRPGRIEGHRLFEGEIDEHVTLGLAKAVQQIAPAPGLIRLVFTCPQRTWPMSREAGAVAAQMLGSTIGDENGGVTLHPGRRGLFADSSGSRVHGAAVLDFFRPIDGERYGCTVFLNPWAQDDAHLSPNDFPLAAVCELNGDSFRWHGDPGESYVVPDGTVYLGVGGGA